MDDPSDDFVRYLLSEVYTGTKTQNVIEKFKPVIKRSLNQFIKERMNNTFKSMIDIPSESINTSENDDEIEEITEIDDGIETTMEEYEAFYIIKSILHETIPLERITFKDTRSYFGLLVDNNTRKWFCRIFIKDNVKYILIPDENKAGVRYDIETMQDIYGHKTTLIEAVNRYLN